MEIFLFSKEYYSYFLLHSNKLKIFLLPFVRLIFKGYQRYKTIVCNKRALDI